MGRFIAPNTSWFSCSRSEAPLIQQLWPRRYRPLSDQRWDYPGVSSPTAHRHDDLSLHPTVKPTALVADAIRDCTKRKRDRTRQLRRLWHYAYRRRNLRPTRSPHRVRPVLLRHDRHAVGAFDRQASQASRGQAKASRTLQNFVQMSLVGASHMAERKTGCGRHLVKSALANHRRMAVGQGEVGKPDRPPEENSKTLPIRC